MSIEVVNYSQKALLVKGNTKPYKEAIKEAGGKWNGNLGGWIFAKTKIDSVNELVNNINNGNVKPEKTNESKNDNISRTDYLNLLTRIERLETLFNFVLTKENNTNTDKKSNDSDNKKKRESPKSENLVKKMEKLQIKNELDEDDEPPKRLMKNARKKDKQND